MEIFERIKKQGDTYLSHYQEVRTEKGLNGATISINPRDNDGKRLITLQTFEDKGDHVRAHRDIRYYQDKDNNMYFDEATYFVHDLSGTKELLVTDREGDSGEIIAEADGILKFVVEHQKDNAEI